MTVLRLRVAFLAPEFLPNLGGVGIYSINLVKELSKDSDFDIHVFTPTRGKDYDRQRVLDYFGHYSMILSGQPFSQDTTDATIRNYLTA
jgi:hypothetical protein